MMGLPMSDAQEPSAEPTPTAGRSIADRAVAERMLRALKAGTDVRRQKVRRVRAAIRALAYENPLKVQVAVDRLTSELPTEEPGPRDR